MWKYPIKKLIWENRHRSLITYTSGALKDNATWTKTWLTITEPCLNPKFSEKNIGKTTKRRSIGDFHVVLRHGRSCQKVCGTLWWSGEQNNLAVVQSIHSLSWGELKSVGELSDVCSQIVLKCLCLARIGRPDIRWSVNRLARAITKWTRACDKRLARFISYVHFTSGPAH